MRLWGIFVLPDTHDWIVTFGKRRNPVLVNSRRNPGKKENRYFLKRLPQSDFAKSRWGSPLSVHKKRIPAGTPPVTGFASFRDPITGCKHNTNILVLPAGLPQSVFRVDYAGIVPSYGNTAQRSVRIARMWYSSIMDKLRIRRWTAQVRRKKAEAADLCQISIVVRRFLRKKNLPFPSFLRV